MRPSILRTAVWRRYNRFVTRKPTRDASSHKGLTTGIDRPMWDRLDPLLDRALELTPDEMGPFLDDVGADDPDLRRSLEALLAADAEASGILDTPAASWPPEDVSTVEAPGLRDALVGETLGPYRVTRRIGSGGMGVVYQAHDTRLERTVALKLLAPSASHSAIAKERLIREARAASALDHPNVCTVYDIGEADGQVFVVMAYYQGETLDAIIRRGSLTPERALDLVGQIGRGLERAHQAGVVHRDLKPSNVLVTEHGEVKILDFGIAKMAGSLGLTRTGQAPGTPQYMAPEQAAGDPVDQRADVWALGVIAYELLCGERPFSGMTGVEMGMAVLHQTPRRLDARSSDVARPIADAVERALAKIPADRWPTAAAFLEALGLSMTSVGAVVTERPTRRFRRSWIVAGVAAIVAAAIGLTMVLGGGGDFALPRSAYRHWSEGQQAFERYWRPGHLDQAVEAFELAIAADDDYAPGYAALARALWRRWRGTRDAQWLDQALANAERAVALDPLLTDGRVTLGLIQLARGDHEEARSLFDEVLMRDPANADAQRGLGDLASAEGDLPAAEAAYREAVRLRPNDLELTSLQGTIHYRSGRYDAASEAFAREIEIDPESSSGYKNLAAVEHMRGRYGEAARLLQHALAIKPEEAVYTNLGTLYFYQGLYQQSREALEKAVDLGAQSYWVWGNLGDAYRWTPGNEAKADEAFGTALFQIAEALRANPADPALSALVAEYRAKRGDTAGASAALDALDALEAEMDVDTLFNATQAAEVAGDRDRALAYLARALDAGFGREEIAREPDLADLRGDPRYQPLIAARASTNGGS